MPGPGKSTAVIDASRATWLFPWALRAVWVATGVLGANAVASALDGRSATVGTVATWSAGIGWLVGVTAMAVIGTVSLTATRVVVPLALPVALVTLVAGATTATGIAFAAVAAVGCVVAFSGELGNVFVQASAYGHEQRFVLRPPFGVGLVAVIAWFVWAAAMIAGPLLLAAGTWVAGAIVTALAAAGTAVLARRWHRLSRRWLVLVPAGVVVHDPVVLGETMMLRRSQVAGLRLAPVDTEALDLTGPTTGHAVEVSVNETVTALFLPTASHPTGRAVHLTAFLVAPSRPGTVLAAARRRHLPVG